MTRKVNFFMIFTECRRWAEVYLRVLVGAILLSMLFTEESVDFAESVGEGNIGVIVTGLTEMMFITAGVEIGLEIMGDS